MNVIVAALRVCREIKTIKIFISLIISVVNFDIYRFKSIKDMMVNKRTLLLPVLFFSFHFGNAQFSEMIPNRVTSYNDIHKVPFQNVMKAEAGMILVAELHYVSCNYQIREEVIKAINKDDYTNILLEYPLSYSILCNRYLKTGDTSILNEIATSCEELIFWKKIFSFNQTLVSERKIHFWGVDFELQGNRKNYFCRALHLLNNESRFPDNIQQAIEKADSTSSLNSILDYKDSLCKLLSPYIEKQPFDPQLGLLELLVNRNVNYKKNRDKEMFDNIRGLDRYLIKSGLDHKYYGQFGMAHINLSNQQALCNFLFKNSQSRWKGDVYFVGTQYLNCYSNYRLKQNTHIISEGVLQSDSPLLKLDTASKSNNESISLIQVGNENMGSKPAYGLFLLIYNYKGDLLKDLCH